MTGGVENGQDLESCGGRKPIGPIRANAEKVQGGNSGLGIPAGFNVIERSTLRTLCFFFPHFILHEPWVKLAFFLGHRSHRRLKALLPHSLTSIPILKTSRYRPVQQLAVAGTTETPWRTSHCKDHAPAVATTTVFRSRMMWPSMPRYISTAAETTVSQQQPWTSSALFVNHEANIGRFHGTPITAWLRVPLDWYQSHTRSFFPDETHASIRRAHTPRHAPHTRRIFCGFCGTPLTFWTEEPREEADFMSVAIGSLFGEDQRALEDLNLLPGDSDEEVSEVVPSSSSVIASSGISPNISRSFRRGTADGIPWFEEMVEGSRLGRLMRARRGMGMSEDQSTTIEWEVSEWHDDGTRAIQQEESDSSGRTTGKRKRRQTEA